MGAKWVRKLTPKSSNRDGGKAGRRLKCTRALWVEPCAEKKERGVPFDVQPYIVSYWSDGKHPRRSAKYLATLLARVAFG